MTGYPQFSGRTESVPQNGQRAVSLLSSHLALDILLPCGTVVAEKLVDGDIQNFMLISLYHKHGNVST